MSTRMRFTQTLLFRVIVAIILGIVCSFFFPEWLARIFVTFNGLFGNFLGFFIPVLICPHHAGDCQPGPWCRKVVGYYHC